MSVESTLHSKYRSNLLFHWGAATLLLLLLIPLVGTDAVWSADVGAQLAQSTTLAEGGGWRFSHPLPDVDPAGAWYPFHLSGRIGSEYVVLAKHPLFTWLVAGLWQAGGLGAVMAASAVATTTAGLGAGTVVASSVHKQCGAATLWITALLSPLVFNGFLGYAHTLAAATTVWSFVIAVRAIQRLQGRYCLVCFAVLLAFVGPFLRSEATLAGFALSLGLLTVAGHWPTRSSRRTARASGFLIGCSTLAAYVLDVALGIQVQYAESISGGSSWFAGRVSGFNATWLQTASSGWLQRDALLLCVPALWFVGAKFLDRPGRVVSSTFMFGAALVAVWTVSDAGRIVPGLLVAFPLLVLLVGLSRVDMFYEPIEAVGAVTFCVFAVAVVLTQHSQGGTSEWGGRYFAVGIPFALIALGGSIQRLIELRGHLRRSVTGPVLLSSLVLVGGGLYGIRTSKQFVGDLEESIAIAARPSVKTPTEQVVVVSTINGVSRWTWRLALQGSWLLVPPEDLDEAMRRLDSSGIDRVVVVAESRNKTKPSFGPYSRSSRIQPWDASPFEILTFDG